MGIATFTDDERQVREEFRSLKNTFDLVKDTYFMTALHFTICSIGMSGDYKMAVEEGSTMVRVGSIIFGAR